MSNASNSARKESDHGPTSYSDPFAEPDTFADARPDTYSISNSHEAVIEAAFWLAVACGVAGALTGNRTAWALLASVAVCFGLEWAQVPFSVPVWMLIDLAVILIIIRPGMTAADDVILALFFPAWAAYFLAPDPRFQIGFIVVVMQLALTFPAGRVWRGVERIADRFNTDRFDRMVPA